MVCTSSPARLQYRQARSEHPGQFSVRRTAISWSTFNAPQHPTRATATSDVFDYIEMFYNPKRKHVRNGMLSPVEFERLQNT
eukprot:gene44929-54950_t